MIAPHAALDADVRPLLPLVVVGVDKAWKLAGLPKGTFASPNLVACDIYLASQVSPAHLWQALQGAARTKLADLPTLDEKQMHESHTLWAAKVFGEAGAFPMPEPFLPALALKKSNGDPFPAMMLLAAATGKLDGLALHGQAPAEVMAQALMLPPVQPVMQPPVQPVMQPPVQPVMLLPHVQPVTLQPPVQPVMLLPHVQPEDAAAAHPVLQSAAAAAHAIEPPLAHSHGAATSAWPPSPPRIIRMSADALQGEEMQHAGTKRDREVSSPITDKHARGSAASTSAAVDGAWQGEACGHDGILSVKACSHCGKGADAVGAAAMAACIFHFPGGCRNLVCASCWHGGKAIAHPERGNLPACALHLKKAL